MMVYLNAAAQKLAPRRFSQRQFPLETLSAVLEEYTGELMGYRKLMKKPNYRHIYRNSYAKEIRRLAQGITGLEEGKNAIFFIDKQAIPVNRRKDVTYVRVVVDYRLDKSDPYRTQLTVGGDIVN